MTEGGDNDPEHLDELLRHLVRQGMKRRKLTQYRLAKASGLSQKHLSQLLNGKTAGSIAVWDRLLKEVSGEEGEQ